MRRFLKGYIVGYNDRIRERAIEPKEGGNVHVQTAIWGMGTLTRYTRNNRREFPWWSLNLCQLSSFGNARLITVEGKRERGGGGGMRKLTQLLTVSCALQRQS